MAKREDRIQDEFNRKLISVNRVTKVVKGGRTMRFSALVAVGDGKGSVGLGMGKAAEVPEAIEKAVTAAKRSMIKVPIVNNTIPHEATGIFGRGQVILLPAVEGTGVIAGGSVRAVLEVTGISNIRTKSLGTNNPINCAKAALQGLSQLKTVEKVAALRGKSAQDIID
jgi:small subunit ribosomal protein S5